MERFFPEMGRHPSGNHSASCPVIAGDLFYRQKKRLDQSVKLNHPPPLTAEVKNAWIFTSSPSVRIFYFVPVMVILQRRNFVPEVASDGMSFCRK
jgi:hypothetical protein